MFILCILFFTRRLFPRQVYLQRLKVVPSLCRLHPNSPSHLTRQEADPPETTYPAAPVSDWRVNQTNHTPTSPFSPANHLARTSTHNLRRNHGRLSPQRSIEIWQLHRWDNRPEAVSLYISVFFPEHHSLWAWGCHSQKTTIRSQIIPAAWAKRKRTGRLKKVRLVLGGNEAIIISMADSMKFSPCHKIDSHFHYLLRIPLTLPHPDSSVNPHGDCTHVKMMLRLCLAAVMHAWHSQQYCSYGASWQLISLNLSVSLISPESLFTCRSTRL